MLTAVGVVTILVDMEAVKSWRQTTDLASDGHRTILRLDNLETNCKQ